MDQEPGGQSDHERLLTEKVMREVSRGKQYQISLESMDPKSVIELRRLLRDLEERAKARSLHLSIAKHEN